MGITSTLSYWHAVLLKYVSWLLKHDQLVALAETNQWQDLHPVVCACCNAVHAGQTSMVMAQGTVS